MRLGLDFRDTVTLRECATRFAQAYTMIYRLSHLYSAKERHGLSGFSDHGRSLDLNVLTKTSPQIQTIGDVTGIMHKSQFYVQSKG